MPDDPAPVATTEPTGQGRAALVVVEADVEFAARDAALLRAIGRTESVAQASSDLGRSRARALARIETLEAAFGDLVERHRGGSGGGGSRLTPTATALLDRYDRLQTALSATAQVPATVLRGRVAAVTGKLAVVDTAIGGVRGRHDGVAVADPVQVRVGADAITVLDAGADPDPDATSARNRFPGRVVEIAPGETVLTVAIDVDGTTFRALVTTDSAARLDLEADREVVITWKATATRLVPTAQ